MPVGDIWYRIEDYATAAPLDEFDLPSGPSTPHARLRTFWVIRETPKGVWLLQFWRHGGDGVMPDDLANLKPVQLVSRGFSPRFQLHESNKRYACPTREEALVSFKARKARQISIWEARAAQILASVELAEQGSSTTDERTPTTMSQPLTVLYYAIIRGSSHARHQAIIAVDKESEKTVTGTYAPGHHHSHMDGGVNVTEPTERWGGHRKSTGRYRFPVAQVLGKFETLPAAQAAWARAEQVPDLPAFRDEKAYAGVSEALKTAREREAEARRSAETYLDNQRRLEAQARDRMVEALRAAITPEPEKATA